MPVGRGVPVGRVVPVEREAATVGAPPLPGCAVCGQALAGFGRCPNGWCHRRDRGFSVAFAVGVHERALRYAVLRYKYRREMWWADIFARLFADHLYRHSTWFEEFDLLVPTPSYLGLSARRNWDPVGEIALRLRGLVHPLWEMALGVVSKERETPPMQGHSAAVRQLIASGPLRRSLHVTEPRRVAGARILVLDDVLTDGSTLREMARALRRSGAREVAGLVLARPAWRDRRVADNDEP
jgi:predicted amidophosphoribosyltransferase